MSVLYTDKEIMSVLYKIITFFKSTLKFASSSLIALLLNGLPVKLGLLRCEAQTLLKNREYDLSLPRYHHLSLSRSLIKNNIIYISYTYSMSQHYFVNTRSKQCIVYYSLLLFLMMSVK